MDMLIFMSEALDRYLRERAEFKLLEDAKTSKGMGIREIILTSAAKIGFLRLVSYNNKLDLNFKDMKFDFVSHEDLTVSDDVMINYVFSRAD